MNEVPHHDHPPRGELTKFVILTVILIGTIGVIAYLRPFIFGHVVPAVLGENIEQSTPVISPETVEEEKNDTPSNATDDTSEQPNEAAGEAEVTTETTDESNNEASDAETEAITETEAAAAEVKTHTVQVGQTLTQIARQYDTTVEAIIQANKLTNPNVVRIGDTLIIPEE